MLMMTYSNISVLISGIVCSFHQLRAIFLYFELFFEFKTLLFEQLQAGIHYIRVIELAPVL
jgi:hypothetical protein